MSTIYRAHTIQWSKNRRERLLAPARLDHTSRVHVHKRPEKPGLGDRPGERRWDVTAGEVKIPDGCGNTKGTEGCAQEVGARWEDRGPEG